MKQISGLINPPKRESGGQPSPSSDSIPTQSQSVSLAGSPSMGSVIALDDRVMHRLWKRMTEFYGHKWVSTYGTLLDDAYETWKKALASVSPEQIAHGLDQCLNHRPDTWPPTLPEFKALCRSAAPESRVDHESHRARPEALPEPPEARKARCAKGLAHMANWREENRLMDWLRDNQGRREGPAGAMLRMMRAMMRIGRRQ